jgi:hypothetical protein
MELLKRPYAERYMEGESPHPCGGFFVTYSWNLLNKNKK